MSRKKNTALAKIEAPTVLPPITALQAEAEKLVPRQEFFKLTFWKDLKDSDKDRLTATTHELVLARRQFGMSALLMGQHLSAVQIMLKGRKGGFAQYLKMFNFGGRTGYRFIEDYLRIKELLQEPVVAIMLATGFRLTSAKRERPLGDYTEAYHMLVTNGENPPKRDNFDAAKRWVDKLERQAEALKKDPDLLESINQQITKKLQVPVKERRDSYDFLIKQSFHLIKSALRRTEDKRKDEFLENLIGYVMSDRELSGRKFVPKRIPDWINRAPGRPREEEAALLGTPEVLEPVQANA